MAQNHLSCCSGDTSGLVEKLTEASRSNSFRCCKLHGPCHSAPRLGVGVVSRSGQVDQNFQWVRATPYGNSLQICCAACFPIDLPRLFPATIQTIDLFEVGAHRKPASLVVRNLLRLSDPFHFLDDFRLLRAVGARPHGHLERLIHALGHLLQVAPEVRIVVGLEEDALRRAVERLPEIEKEIVKRRYGLNGDPDPQSLEQVGRHLGMSRERVRQIESRALQRLAEEREIAA